MLHERYGYGVHRQHRHSGMATTLLERLWLGIGRAITSTRKFFIALSPPPIEIEAGACSITTDCGLTGLLNAICTEESGGKAQFRTSLTRKGGSKAQLQEACLNESIRTAHRPTLPKAQPVCIIAKGCYPVRLHAQGD